MPRYTLAIAWRRRFITPAHTVNTGIFIETHTAPTLKAAVHKAGRAFHLAYADVLVATAIRQQQDPTTRLL